jgi:hypothetical protein
MDQRHPSDSGGATHRHQPPFAEAADRRRPGRLGEIRPPLIPLLRFHPASEAAEALRRQIAEIEDCYLNDDEDDDLRASRGILFALVNAGLVWTVAGMLLVWLW